MVTIMNKKLYIKPLCRTADLHISSIICMSFYDDEAPFVGISSYFGQNDSEEFYERPASSVHDVWHNMKEY